MPLRKGPRECVRCGETKPPGNFAAAGRICFECWMVAVNARSERRYIINKKAEMKILARPRVCRRCKEEKPADQFSLYGAICWACYGVAKQARKSNARAVVRAAKSVGGETKLPARVYLMGELV